MSDTEGGYKDARSFLAAVKDTAKKNRTTDVGASLTQAVFDRLLSRVFASGEESGWLLKGGTSMLARVPNTRTTKDIDLASEAPDIDKAVAALKSAAGQDLDDHLTFVCVEVKETGKGQNQPGVQTRRVTFECQDDTGARIRAIAPVHVDVVVGPPPVGRPEVVVPSNRLTLKHPLASHPYRLFPIADQTAEKVVATMSTYGGKPSSRVKDLVDLVVIAHTQRLDLHELRDAIDAKRRLSRVPAFTSFTTPDDWEKNYRALAATTPIAQTIPFDQARAIASTLVDPALTQKRPTPHTWIPGHGWSSPVPIGPKDPP